MSYSPPNDMTGEMSEEDIQQLIALGIIPDQQSSLDKQMETAKMLRYNNMPEMRGNSRVQTAANPLEFLVSGVQGYKAGKEMDAIKKKQDELLGQQVSGRTKFFRGMQRRPPTAQPDVFEEGEGYY